MTIVISAISVVIVLQLQHSQWHHETIFSSLQLEMAACDYGICVQPPCAGLLRCPHASSPCTVWDHQGLVFAASPEVCAPPLNIKTSDIRRRMVRWHSTMRVHTKRALLIPSYLLLLDMPLRLFHCCSLAWMGELWLGLSAPV